MYRTKIICALSDIIKEAGTGTDDAKLIDMLGKLEDLYKPKVMSYEEFSKIHPSDIFKCGEGLDSPEGINMTRSGKLLRWVAVKGHVNDWAVYCYWATSSYIEVAEIGDKVHTESTIRKLVPCDDEVFSRYRY